ncbi:MAG: flagellar hook-basal body complex protein FliE [Planctomycetota bacterium]
MADPIGLIGQAGGAQPLRPLQSSGAAQNAEGGPDFKNVLMDNLEKVNAAQRDADQAVEDLVTGKRDDLEGVILATQKADGAFKMLQAMRNKVMEAYEEISNVRV